METTRLERSGERNNYAAANESEMVFEVALLEWLRLTQAMGEEKRVVPAIWCTYMQGMQKKIVK